MNFKYFYLNEETEDQFIYGLPLRPASIGAVPDGYIKYNEFGSYDDSGERDRSTRHGTVIYPFELSLEQIKKFDLVPIHNNKYINEYIENVWDKIKKYANDNAIKSIKKIVNGNLVMQLKNITKPSRIVGDIINKVVSQIIDNNIDVNDEELIKKLILDA